ncbi:uncharacterized protein K452DRAFT_223356 [Aplosporella prunicola CBS 121167]|uniref:SEC7 domain-containing protein n=1 Tax=Aplosporella prunicola CBS 121167 TaxID=1176127 RepID=A0A6A6BNQ5_9PEZI|nr:uncharacterized protein K452DRAFT_223356 [Aplosporella prunicola CBS 121167]KAF2144191.1 hypothetical protein K452DRAFT_223356 [Aplosporella prunicola CBS 121167]
MPLRALRPGRSDKDLKRRSTLDPANLFRRGEQAPHGIRSAENLAPDRGIRSSDGLRPQTQQSHPVWLVDTEPPPSPPVQEHNTMTRRFSKLRSRHASDPQLSAKAREQAAADAAAAAPPVPTMPAAPAIIMTAPTMESPTQNPPTKKKNKFPTLTKRRLSFEPTAEESIPRKSTEKKHFGSNGRKTIFGGLEHLQDEPGRLSTSSARDLPTMTGSEANHALRPVGGRLSDGSSRSIESTGEHRKPVLNTSHSTFFRLSRKNKEQNRKSLFPLPVKIPAPPEFPDTAPATPRASTSAVSVPSPHQSPDGTYSPPLTAIHRSNTDGSAHPDQSPTHSALASVVNVNGAPLIRNDSTTSAHSARSTPSLAPPVRLGRRGRSSTVGSVEGRIDDGPPPTPPQYGRHSTSTTGRTSFSNLFGLGNRFRQNSEPQSPRHGSPGQGMTSGRGSHSTSMNISRETLAVPPREEGEPPGRYLERLEEIMPRSTIAAVVAKSGDEFSLAVLRSYMRRFMFFGDPIDMALRKLLMEVELPRETQQIDRVLQGFADRYHECNPGIFVSPEEAYFIAFSIVLLNSDFFNPNNKRKMQKPDYIKNCNGTSASEVNEDVLATIYENIVYTQFIHIDDEMDLRNIATRGKKKKIIKNAVQDPARRAQKEPIDPYTLIFENKLDALRPPIKEVMQFEDPYCYRGTAQSLDMRSLHDTFAKYGVIQIVSARSRPEAFMSPTTIENPNDAQAGVVEMPVTKVGILWRKDTKKKAARSPWQEWGVVLTRSSLYFFKSPTWARNLMHQHENRNTSSGAPVIFKPAVEDFKSDHTVPMDLCVAAMDASYRKHKYAFVIFAKGGAEEVFLADNEPDMNDWLAKINYTAAFETAGIRPRGLTGGNYEGQRNRGIRRLESSQSSKSIQGPTGEVTIQSGKIDNHLAQQIASARRDNIQRKVEEADERLGNAVKQLDSRLRDARHLQVMAPIQPRTREHVMHAAGRMAARLKWVRIDICRMKCHRDILIMDLDEEKRAAGESQLRNKEIADSATPATSSPAPTAPPSRSSRLGSLVRLNSKASSATARPQTSPNPPPPEIVPPREPEQEKDDDVFSTPENSPQSSPGHPPTDWVIPPMSFSPLSEPRHSLIMSKVENPDHRPSVSTTGDQEGSEVGSKHRSGSISDADHSHPRNQSTTSMNLDGRPSTPENGEQNPAGSPDSRAKMRRSMHRTLRDPHTSGGHRRSGKGKESSSTIMSEDTADKGPEVLPRAHGSFTVHGKKASVITFGSEWQDLSAEERLKLRKQALEDGKRLEIPTAHEDDRSVNGTEGAPSISTASESAHTITSKPMVEKEGGVGLKPAPLDQRWNHLSAPGQQQSTNAASSINTRPSVEDLSPTTKEFPKEAKDGDAKDEEEGQAGGPDPAIISTQPQAVGA